MNMLSKSSKWFYYPCRKKQNKQKKEDRDSGAYSGASKHICSLVSSSVKLMVWARWFSNVLSSRKSPFASPNTWQGSIHVSMLDRETSSIPMTLSIRAGKPLGSKTANILGSSHPVSEAIHVEQK